MQQLQNFGTTTLNGAINSLVTTITVTDGTVFPASGDYYIIVDNEIMKVTARSSNNLTVVRGQESTTAASHVDTSGVKLSLTKAAIEGYFGERVQVGGYASRPATARAGWIYYASDINLAWQYDGGNWNLYHPLYVPYANRVDLSSWTGVNLSTSTWTDTNGVLTVGAISVGGVDAIRLYHKALPTAPYKINAILQMASLSGQFSGAGIGLYNSTNGKLANLTTFNTGNIQSMSVDKYNSTSSFSSNQVRLQHWGSPFWLQIEDDNTNWTWRVSFDGVHYLQLYQEARNTFVTPDKVCLLIDRTENTVTGDEYYQFLAYWEQ